MFKGCRTIPVVRKHRYAGARHLTGNASRAWQELVRIARRLIWVSNGANPSLSPSRCSPNRCAMRTATPVKIQ